MVLPCDNTISRLMRDGGMLNTLRPAINNRWKCMPALHPCRIFEEFQYLNEIFPYKIPLPDEGSFLTVESNNLHFVYSHTDRFIQM